ncbi:MAG TPA: DUF4404 family protein [Verrucomicrobiae bacterium]|nr:DUF4404 family protein [Verrucomicrobiae bacterium]
MLEETISRIEERLRAANSLPSAERAELEDLLQQLRREAGSLALPKASDETFTEDETAHSAISRLEQSLTEFEATHPHIVGLVNRISSMLSNMGI